MNQIKIGSKVSKGNDQGIVVEIRDNSYGVCVYVRWDSYGEVLWAYMADLTLID